MYAINFTEGFKYSIEDLPEQVLATLSRFITRLKDDPFQNLPNARAMTNARGRFRAKIGREYRLIYRIEKAANLIVLLTIGARKDVYRQQVNKEKILGVNDAEQLSETIYSTKTGSAKDINKDEKVNINICHDDQININNQIEFESELIEEWITADELWLLDIDDAHHEKIINSSSIKSIENVVSDEIYNKLLAYVTSPITTHIGKLYNPEDSEITSWTSRSLRDFLLQVDKEQQRVIDCKLDSGPILVKGGPGTGKSLVGLYRIFHIVTNRSSESMFDKDPTFGILTYTNTLSDLNDSLTGLIKKKLQDEGTVVCSTIDKFSYNLAHKALGRRPDVLKESELSKLYKEDILPGIGTDAEILINKLGIEYITTEIESVIFGYGLFNIQDYLDHKRSGRGKRLSSENRTIIWKAYESFLRFHIEKKRESWGLLRRIALEYLTSSDYPRFNALFVDEVQDLSRTSRKIILNLVKDRRFLLMTADTGQSIYELPLTWKEVDSSLSFSGNKTFVLRRNYRTSKQIYKAIESLRIDASDGEQVAGKPMPVFTGPLPIWMGAAGAGQFERLMEAINTLRKKHQLGQIGVIVRDHSDLKRYQTYLNNNDVPARIVSKESKIDIEDSHVHLITAHSSKGLEFPAVVVPDLSDDRYPGFHSDTLDQESDIQDNEIENEQRLLYVALSRACHSLVIIENTDKPSRFLKLLDKNDWKTQ